MWSWCLSGISKAAGKQPKTFCIHGFKPRQRILLCYIFSPCSVPALAEHLGEKIWHSDGAALDSPLKSDATFLLIQVINTMQRYT